MHDNRRGRQAGFFDLIANSFDHFEVQRLLTFEFVSAVTGADGGGERIAFGLLDELNSLIRIGQASMSFVHFDIFLDASEHAELGLDADSFGVCFINDAFAYRDVFFK